MKSTASFDRALERSTSQLLLEPDWDSILQLCDCIRQEDVTSKYAINAIKKKISAENPHVAIFALQVLEAVVKNCGSSIHDEVSTKDFMDFCKELIKRRPDPVKNKALELIQLWSHAFRNTPKYSIVQNTFDLLRMEGHQFPSLQSSDAMFLSEAAPEWMDGGCCNRCRVSFTTFQRKHHCRNCGQVFCAKCSNKQAIIPKFGLEREVRVCNSCFEELTKNSGKKTDTDLPAEYLASPLSQQSQVPVKKTEHELQEEEELQLAMALSQSEEEAKAKDKRKYTGEPSTSTVKNTNFVQQQKATPAVIDTSDMDPELARYLNRNYWEQKAQDIPSTQPSAPAALASEPKTSPVKLTERLQNGSPVGSTGASGDDETVFLSALRSSIEIFMNRMASNSQRGRSIANDSSVQTMFMTLTAMHPRLIGYTQQQEDTRAYFERLQDKLTQLKDAREALDVLRAEQLERRRLEKEEQDRQRQIQMAQTLGVLRQKKQEYLEYQRQLALQRTHEHEMAMQMRAEQQKQMQMMRAMQYSSGFPLQAQSATMQAQPGTMQPQPAMQPQQQQVYGAPGGGSPLHQAYPQQAMQSPGQPIYYQGQYYQPQPVYMPGQMAPNMPGQPMPTQGQPMRAQGQPMQAQGQPMQAQGQPMPPQGQVMSPSQQLTMPPGNVLQGQPGVMQGQPTVVPGQPGVIPHSGNMLQQQGQVGPMPTDAGNTMTTSGMPMRSDGQPYMSPPQGQPMAYPPGTNNPPEQTSAPPPAQVPDQSLISFD